ncbi:MAG: cysteine desulfurase [Candidatus Woesearchaeota archaeon]
MKQKNTNIKTNGEFNFKKDFPILKNICYLDNSATTQKPISVISRMTKIYLEENANSHSGVYDLSEKTAKNLQLARDEFANFINAKSEEIIFTRNATDSFNLLAELLEEKIKKGNNIISTEIEHHSNFVLWQQLSFKKNAEFVVAKYNKLDELISPEKLVNKNTAIVSFSLMSNVSGLIPDAQNIIKEIRKKNKNTIIIVDATQAAAHIKIDVVKLDCDFLCFSAHKIYGPTGVGILYGKKELLENLEPKRYGGGMIRTVSKDKSTWANLPDKLESGTSSAEAIICAANAINYLNKKDVAKLFLKENELKKYALQELKKIKGISIIGHKKSNHGPVISFTMREIHPHDVAEICARKNVCIRAGHHCAQPFHESLGIVASSRISISFYNDKTDIDKFIIAINDVNKIMRIK